MRNDNDLYYDWTDIACPACKAPVGDWCTRGGGGLLTCAERQREVTALNVRRNTIRQISFHEWLTIGRDNQFCTPPTCAEHDGILFSEEERTELDDAGELCYAVVRIFHSDDHAKEVEHDNPDKLGRIIPDGYTEYRPA